MLALTIREKNGDERQLLFDKEEVTIGRANGSDIVLPRNNISKRHARLVDKHDKVVIVDLRSTNGTYVNGRRITAPELLTLDDKVYIGDFVIRLANSATAGVAAAPEAAAPPFPPPGAQPSPRTAHAPTVAGVAGLAGGPPKMPAAALEPAPVAPPVAPPAEVEAPAELPEFVDDDESTQAINLDDIAKIDAAPALAAVPAPPSAPPVEFVEADESTQAISLDDVAKIDAMPDAQELLDDDESTQAISLADVEKAASAEPLKAALQKRKKSVTANHQEPETAEVAAPQPAAEPADAPAPTAAGEWDEWNATVGLLVELVAADDDVETLSWEQCQKKVAEALQAAIETGDIGSDVERDALVQDAAAELVGYGPLAELLEDGEVERISVMGHERIRVWRAGASEIYGRVFASESSLQRVGRRIATDMGYDATMLPSSFEGTLTGAVSVAVVGPPVSSTGTLIQIRRPVTRHATLDGLQKSKSLNKAARQRLGRSIEQGESIVVTGRPGSGRTSLVAALVSEIDGDARVAIVSGAREIGREAGDTIYLSSHGEGGGTDALESVGALELDWVIVDDLNGSNVADVVAVALTSGASVIAVGREANAERLLKRISLQLELLTGVPLGERAAAMVGEAFDVAVEMTGRGDSAKANRVFDIKGEPNGFTLRASK